MEWQASLVNTYQQLIAQAMEAIEELRQAVDALIIIPNDKLLQSKRLPAPRS